MHVVTIGLFCLRVTQLLHAEPLTLPLEQRSEWVSRDGIVMAGSWEPLLFRVRRDGSAGYTPTLEQQAAYSREHTPQMIAQLKSLGVNFVMMHCYKGFGLSAERESMTDAVRFARLCHAEGLRVGVYTYSGAFGWELLFKEVPEASDWVVLDHEGKPKTYGRATYRYYWNRNHPDAQAFYRNIVRFAVKNIGADLLHFDNYVVGPGSDANSVERFRTYLREKFTRRQLEQMGVPDPASLEPPLRELPDNLLWRAWLDFSCQSLSDSYHDMSRFARTLRQGILVECNPGGVADRIFPPVDHGRLLQGGEAFWDEGPAPGYRQGKLQSRIRTYKVARRMDNMAFTYTTNPLEMAESMAFSLPSLGCVCWFEYGKMVEKPGSQKPVSKSTSPFIRFFHQRRDLFRNSTVLADVAVLRSFPSQVFANAKYADQTNATEQALILSRLPFQIIYDHHLNDLDRYRVLLLAGCVALSDRHVERILHFVGRGGQLCVVGPAATHNEWMLPRKRSPLDQVLSAKYVDAADRDSIIEAARTLCAGKLSLATDGPEGLCAELTEQNGRRLVHLVNYRPDEPARNVTVRIRLPAGKTAKTVALASPLREKDDTICFDQEVDEVEFAVPAVEVYEIAVVTYE